MTNRFFDLAWNRQADGSIRLTQTDCGDPYIVDAHPEQILFIARQLCGMKPETTEKVEELERRIAILTDRLGELVTADWFRNQIIDRCADGIEMITKLDGLLDLAIEFDGGRLLPSASTESPQEASQDEEQQADQPRPSNTRKGSANGPQMGLPV